MRTALHALVLVLFATAAVADSKFELVEHADPMTDVKSTRET
jgi:hypothetical protein